MTDIKAHGQQVVTSFAGYAETSVVSSTGKVKGLQASAVISMAGRYPGSHPDAGLSGFWNAIQSQKDLPSTVPLQRWDIEEYFSPESKSQQLSMYVRMAAFVDQLDHFDNSVFRYDSSN